MSLLEDLRSFRSRIPEPADNRSLNRLNASFNVWHRYYGFLRIIAQRYADLDRTHLDAMRLRFESIQKDIAADRGPRPVTLAEEAESLRIAEITSRLHLEIESFYVFAKILVDRMADTFAFYFGHELRRAGSTHTQLANWFERICRERGLIVVPEELPSILREVSKRIVQYRTDDIEHVSEPGLMHATTYHMTEGKARILPGVVCPDSPEESGRKYATKHTEVPEELFPLIDEYMAALVCFFAANAGKSIAMAPDQQA